MGGKGTPVDGLDAACMQHDQCYAQNGFTAGSNFGAPNSALQGCNQALCTAAQTVQTQLVGSVAMHGPPVIGPSVPSLNQANEYLNAGLIQSYFSLGALGQNACH
jgi:hypothetical protein